jgi:hypothetical protein
MPGQSVGQTFVFVVDQSTRRGEFRAVDKGVVTYTVSITCRWIGDAGRSWLRLSLGKGDEVVSDARAYLNLEGWRNDFSTYAALVGYLGANQAGHDADAIKLLDECAARCDGTKWAMQIVRFLRRETTESALLVQATDNDKLTEAHTYAGLALAFAGKRNAALAHLRWVADNGNERFYEYMPARLE